MMADKNCWFEGGFVVILGCQCLLGFGFWGLCLFACFLQFGILLVRNISCIRHLAKIIE